MAPVAEVIVKTLDIGGGGYTPLLRHPGEVLDIIFPMLPQIGDTASYISALTKGSFPQSPP